ncbi:SURF1 family protein [Pseudoroseomonas globiformis]|uniref:SURF1-like protein n=1 Tax=Teichococcus globiformis TaxID=2307229 RepID=A0ABV7FWX9_9PROT
MTPRPRWRRLLIPFLATLPVLLILLGLGTWQVQRLQWKTALLADFAAAEAAPALPIGPAPSAWTKVFATGRFLHEREALLGIEVRNQVMGANLVVPLQREGAPPLLVNRGWVPLERQAPLQRPEGQVRVEGYVRPSDSASWVSATDDPSARRFYTFDTALIGAALGLDRAEPFALVALGPAGGPLPWPAPAMPRPANNHLGYVITWYGLALALVGVFIAWARTRLKETALHE